MEIIDYYVEIQRVMGLRITIILAVVLLIAVIIKAPAYMKSYKNRKLPR